MKQTNMNAKPRLLVVDDDIRDQHIVVEIIGELFDFKVASTGEEALQIAETYLPDLVLLDIMMAGIDGYEVCGRIRANPRLSTAKIILISGKAKLEERLKGYLCGCDDYLIKPFMPEELLAKIKVFLKGNYTEKQAASRLIQSAKMSALGEMAAGVAHEINTPLNIMSLNADLIDGALGKDVLNSERVRKYNDVNRKTLERISTIIRALCNFSRDGSLDASVQVPLVDVIQSTVTLCKERMNNSSVELKVTGDYPGLNLKCRPVEMSQVLLNLFNNAMDAVVNLPEKWIHLDITEEGEEIVLSVSNSGPKIPAAVRDQIFNPFFTTKAIGMGTGLGLSISLGIIKSHRGSLVLDESSLFTKFVIRLPRIEEAKAS